MRRLITALTVIAVTLVVAPAANAASSQQILAASVPAATDGLDEIHSMVTNFAYSVANVDAGEENCAYFSTQYRALGATDALGAAWREVPMYHGLRASVPLAGAWGTAYGAKTVQFRIGPNCNPNSSVITKRIQYLKPHALDPVVEVVTVPSKVSTDTVSVAIAAKAGPYDAPKTLQVRFATETGQWQAPTGEWGQYAAYKPVMTAPVSDGVGTKGLFVMVVDGQRDSNIKFVRFTRVKAAAPSAAVNNAPVLTAISTPATVAGATVTVTVKASDDNAVKRIRFATEDGNWTAWRAYAGTSYAAPVSAGRGFKGVFVQVQDAGYATSSILYRKYTRVS